MENNNSFKEKCQSDNMPDYQLKPEDFIPIAGLINHHNRSINEMLREHLVGDDNYMAQAGGRDGFLILYNAAVFLGTLEGLSLIVSQLIK